MFEYKSMECLHQLIKKQASVCWYISLNPYFYGISNLKSWGGGGRKKNSIVSLLLAYIADASCLTSISFYVRTFSLRAGLHFSQFLWSL